ncbi:putative Heavy metal transport/detoxification superfamily protein [Quillaja saponaria]|uniref:Heavy metal transport/detoxification superfamily protein n=1 Tax=Quillaja saponaria TaxID=32244 RepID=A0AAD7PQ78_QUISA|nr:putative Heavy metal transport/detoxification superfamily protein [Quillaja saponaria]
MKQKIIMKVEMDSEKCRSKALQIAAVAQGVSSVSIEGKDKDEVVVVGEEVDSVCLAMKLRKKLGHARIVSVQEVKGGGGEGGDAIIKIRRKKLIHNVTVTGRTPYYNCSHYCPPPNPVYYGKIVCDPNPSGCSIMLHFYLQIYYYYLCNFCNFLLYYK